jgi:GNAT superfamily N-acetyltransferase
METNHRIVLARPEHMEALRAIELAAATLLRGHAPDSVLAESLPPDELRAAQQEGRLWVAELDDVAIGFAIVQLLAPDLPHLQEIDVLPRHGRRGVGTALVQAVLAWVARRGHRQITLTTFRDVPWNMPFYAKMGFVELAADRLRPELEAIVRDETRRGLDPARRVVMRHGQGAG